jgi:hypothetical protein
LGEKKVPDENINLKKNFPNDDLIKERQEMRDSILAEDEAAEIVIWPDDDGDEGIIVFLSIGNVTISMAEAQFYALTKQTQVAAKKLLKID